MDSKEIAESLRKLAGDKTKRNKTGILREVLDDIEACLAAGVSQADVIKVLNGHGLGMTYVTFGSTLRRLRQQRTKQGSVKLKSANTNPSGIPAAHPDKRMPGTTPQPGEASSGNQSEGETDNQQTIFNPSDLRKVLSEKVDLNKLAKIGRELNRKKKNEERSD